MEIKKNTSEKLFYYDKNSRNALPTIHYHELLEIYLMVEGECEYFIENKCYKVKKDDIVIIPEGIPHKAVYLSDSHTRKLINCSRHYVPGSVKPMLSSLLYIYRNPKIKDKITGIFEEIEQEYQHKDKHSEEVLLNLTSSLFILMIRNLPSRLEIENENSYIENTVRFVQENFSSSITLKDAADMSNISPEHLCRVFKKYTGFGFNEYLNLLRIQKAEILLKTHPELSVSEIAFNCGFNDSNYFSDKFKKKYGFPPSHLKLKKI